MNFLAFSLITVINMSKFGILLKHITCSIIYGIVKTKNSYIQTTFIDYFDTFQSDKNCVEMKLSLDLFLIRLKPFLFSFV